MSFCHEDPQRQNRLKEYRMLFDAIWHRGQAVWLVNSVLIPSSILIILQATIHRKYIGNIASGSFSTLSVLLALYCLMFYASTQKVNKICWDRIHKIEEQLEMQENTGNRLIKSELDKRWWYPIRRYQWYVFLFILLVVDLHVAILNFLNWNLALF